MYVVIGAEHCRRQLSQWQFTQVWTGVSISNLMAPHKQRPRIIDLLGNILSFKVRAFRVAAKYVLKVNAGDHVRLGCRSTYDPLLTDAGTPINETKDTVKGQ